MGKNKGDKENKENEEKIRYFRIIINGIWVDINEDVWFKNINLISLAALLWVYQKCEEPFARYAYNELKRRWEADKSVSTFKDLWNCVKKKEDPLWRFALNEIFEKSDKVTETADIIKKTWAKRR